MSCPPRPLAGALWAAAATAVLLAVPGRAHAVVNYGMTINHQQTDTERGSVTTSSTQDRFSMFFNLATSSSSRLTIKGDFRLDVLMSERAAGSETIELQPNLQLKLSTKAVQTGIGYRKILRDDTAISGTATTTITSDSTDIYFDTAIRAGKLPDTRLRYNTREQTQQRDGAITASTKTDDIRGSINYRLGIFALNADYAYQTSKDSITGLGRDQSQANGQLSMTKAIGSKLKLSLRENYNITSSDADTAAGGTTSTKRTISTSEARAAFTPAARMLVDTSYVYRVQDDQQSETTEAVWVTNASYAMPRFLRFYGTYSTRETDTGAAQSSTGVKIAGANFKHQVGKFNFAARYEKRVQENEAANAEPVKTTRDNIDALVTVDLARYLNLTLSDAYVLSDSPGGESTSNTVRVKANIGPIKTLVLSPYIDYRVSVPENNIETKTTEMVVPASFRLDLGKGAQLAFTDNFRRRLTETQGVQNESQTNSMVFRLAMPKILGSTSVSGDASFNTNMTKAATTTTSVYTMRVNWLNAPHRVDTNFSYQTGSNTTDSMRLGLQYGLNLKMKKLTFSMTASYKYDVTFTTPQSTGQSLLVLLSLRK